ncbi:MAG: RNB domain-containing ribonuclease [Desulfohalobiaceae bacterium]|nr:RNB domain-containing ribonuclease [Desulfohalobiaceae bacterium]
MKLDQANITPGCLVEYLHDNQPLLGFVQEEQGRQLRVLNHNKRQVKLTLSRVLPWVGPKLSTQLSRSEILDAINAHDQKRRKIQAEIDSAELWELTMGEISEGTANWFAGLLWNTPDEDQVAAVGRAMLENKALFKFQPPCFKVFDPETVQAKLAEQESLRKKRLLLAHGQSFFQALLEKAWKEDAAELPELPPEVASELSRILLSGIRDPEDPEFVSVWKVLRKGLPDDPHLPLLLAQAWDLLPKHYNYLLDQAGYNWGDAWAEGFEQEIEQQIRTVQAQREEDEDLNLISIDSKSTRDIDDAFTIEPSPRGFVLKLGLACPVMGWDFGSKLDQRVFQRMSSLYLPEGTSHMLPEKLGTGFFSLHAGTSKPILLFTAELDQEGQLLDMEFRTTRTTVAANKTYDQAEQELEHGDNPVLNQALELAGKLREQRIKNGAVIIEQEDPSIVLGARDDDFEVLLQAAETHPGAQLIVSELMILANQAVAEWAIAKDLPLIYRTQDIALPGDRAGVWQDPVDIYHLIRELSSAKIDTAPRPHSSLGVSSYAPVTSPLRRYVDFMNMAQVHSLLSGNRPLWSKEELEAKLPYLTARMQAVTNIQRSRTKYWKLLYFQRHCKVQHWSGVVVGINDKRITLSLPESQIMIQGHRNIFNEKTGLGDRYTLKLGKVNPLQDEIKIMDAWEES